MDVFAGKITSNGGSVNTLHITPAIKYLNIVIPAKAGIQEGTGCRIKSGMTELDYLITRLIYSKKTPGTPIESDLIDFFGILTLARGIVAPEKSFGSDGTKETTDDIFSKCD